MKNKDHILLEQMYAKVKPVKLYQEEYTDKVEDNRFIAEIEDIMVDNVDPDSYSLGIESDKLTLIYEIEFDFRKWGIKDFLVHPKKIMPFRIVIEDDYNEEDFSGPKTLVEFSEGVDASDFKTTGVALKQAYSLYPTSIELSIKQIDGKWQVIPQQSEISFS
jgi:hypothetical protein